MCFQQCAMRLSRPDDQMGSTLLLELPTLITHRIDNWSPLMPPPGRAQHDNGAGGNSSGSDDSDDSGDGDVHGRAARAAVRALRRHDPRTTYEFPELPLRADDADGGGRSSLVCLVCGEAYDTKEQLALHCASCAVDEVFSGHHVGTVCRETGEVLPSLQGLRRYCEENDFAPPDQQPKDDGSSSDGDDDSSSSSSSSEDDDEKKKQDEKGEAGKQKESAVDNIGAAAAAFSSETGGSNDKKPKKKKDDEKKKKMMKTRRMVKVYKSLNEFDKNDSEQRRHSSMNHLEYLPLVDDYEESDVDDENEEMTSAAGGGSGEKAWAAAATRRRKSKKKASAAAAEAAANKVEVAAMERYFRESELEVVVLLEAIESETSCTIQSRFSYSFLCGDLLFNRTFVPSVRRAPHRTATEEQQQQKQKRRRQRRQQRGWWQWTQRWVQRGWWWQQPRFSLGGSNYSGRGGGGATGGGAGGHAVVDLERFHRTRRVAANAAHFRDAQAHA